MRAFLMTLVAVLAIAGTAAAGDDEAPLDSPPEWIKKPSYEELKALWPREALIRGRGGRATIECEITPHGVLESCKVIDETPPGEGFGEAALLLVPSFVLRPGMRDGKPVRTKVRFPIRFKTEGPQMAGRATPMVMDSVWETAPSFADMAAAWPQGAKAEFGHVSMRCRLTAEGTLHRCDVLTETPRGQGFGRAARTTVAAKFKMRMAPDDAQDLDGVSVNIPVRFENPASAEPHAILQPRWITAPDPQKSLEIYPPAAAKAGVKVGRGVANCLVDADGRLTDCKPAEATPEGFGFAEAAVQIASLMQMNPWSDGGGPVDGVRIKLPIRFELAPGTVGPPTP